MVKKTLSMIGTILTVVTVISMFLPQPDALFPDETVTPMPDSLEVPIGTSIPIQIVAMNTVPLREPGAISQTEIKSEMSRAWDIIEQGLGRSKEGRETFQKLFQSVSRYHNRLIQTGINGRSANSVKAVKSVYTLVYTLAQKFGKVGKGMFIMVPLNSCELAVQMGAEIPQSCGPKSSN